MKKKQDEYKTLTNDEEIASAFSNKKRWSNYYLVPIFLALVTITMLLLVIFLGPTIFPSNSANS